MAWLQEHAQLVSAAASIGTLAIWAIYLHLFVASHRRQIKPMLVINRGQGRTLDARCLLTNMSREPVHVQSVVARLITDDGKTHTSYITDAEDIRNIGQPTGWQVGTRQGPLAPGQMIDMGAYGYILDYAVKSRDAGPEFLQSEMGLRTKAFEIIVLGIYGSEDLLIGASRMFEVDRHKPEIEIRATTAQTHQITRSRERRRLSRELAEQL